MYSEAAMVAGHSPWPPNGHQRAGGNRDKVWVCGGSTAPALNTLPRNKASFGSTTVASLEGLHMEFWSLTACTCRLWLSHTKSRSTLQGARPKEGGVWREDVSQQLGGRGLGSQCSWHEEKTK